MEIVTTSFTNNDEIMSNISLIDCGKEIDHYVIYDDGKSTSKYSEDLHRTASDIQHFIERVYDLGQKGVNIEFYSKIIPIVEDKE